MGFIDDELRDVSNLCQNVVEGSRLVSCVRSMVRVEIEKTAFKKIIVCIQFPNGYPQEILLIELKSKTLSSKQLDLLTGVCEKECQNLVGKAQVLPVLKFIQKFIETHPLICCYNELISLKKIFTGDDVLHMQQKHSRIRCEMYQDSYYFKLKINIPEEYPVECVTFSDVETNFPSNLKRYIFSQAKEIARRCVEPPIKQKPNQPRFEPSPSLYKVADFIISSIKRFPNEKCLSCKKNCLPADPKDIDENSEIHAERLYCGHLIHIKCLKLYMKTPPFQGGKKCLECGQRIYHEKWGLCDKLAEARWAHEQARARELAEVTDFFQ